MSVPSSIEPGRAPGGLFAALFVDGELVDGAPLLDELTDVGGVALRHAIAALSAAADGRRALVVIYDGDTGEIVLGGLSAPSVHPAGGELRHVGRLGELPDEGP